MNRCRRCNKPYVWTGLGVLRRRLKNKYGLDFSILYDQCWCSSCLEEIEGRLGKIKWGVKFRDLANVYIVRSELENNPSEAVTSFFLLLSLAEEINNKHAIGEISTHPEDLPDSRLTHAQLREEFVKYSGIGLSDNSWYFLRGMALSGWDLSDLGLQDVFKLIVELRSIEPSVIELSEDLKSQQKANMKREFFGFKEFINQSGHLTWESRVGAAKEAHPEWPEFPSGEAMRKYYKRHYLS